jgi:hypothetical protein
MNEMTIKLDDTVICKVVTQPAEGGVTYALIRPDGRTNIYGRRSYLNREISNILREAVYERLTRQENLSAAAS